VGLGVLALLPLTASADRADLRRSAQRVASTDTADEARSAVQTAQHLFYSAKYREAAEAALAARLTDPQNLETYELRSSALHFQIKRALELPTNPKRSIELCDVCPVLMTAFLAETTAGLELARARLREAPGDEDAMFYVGKLNLNWVWLQLGTLSRKTGWSEYWEARKTLDAVIARHPDNIRARVARAWIDYIVGTRVPRGTRWLLGGGNRKKALTMVGQAAAVAAERFVHAEAGFALWDMQVRERNFDAAVASARELLIEFPDNQELKKFLTARGTI
jgi:hypothetical protein